MALKEVEYKGMTIKAGVDGRRFVVMEASRRRCMSSRIRTATGAPFEPRGTFHEHMIAIHDLAHDFDLSELVVADMYWPELASLQEGATIDVYLPLLTERRVRERLRRGSGPGKGERSEEHADQLVAA